MHYSDADSNVNAFRVASSSSETSQRLGSNPVTRRQPKPLVFYEAANIKPQVNRHLAPLNPDSETKKL
jgi:hypothetical protein